MKFHYVTHNFQPIKIQNNVMLARCNCCTKPRYAVFISDGKSRIFKYHGFDEQYARNLFNFLVQKQAQQAQIQ